MYSYDEDFKKIFKIKAEFNPIVKIDEDIKSYLVRNIYNICKNNNLKSVKDEGIKEVAKYLSRKAENKNKMYFNLEELDKILILANNKVENEKKDFIDAKDIISIAYNEDIIEKEILEAFEENKIFLNVKDNLIGEVNGLTVLDTGYTSFGKPVRITCSCYYGDGNIIDVQKSSELSGKNTQ